MIVLAAAALLALLYGLAILPRLVSRPDHSVFLGRHYAHRGLHDVSCGIPENSIAAFTRAIDAGYGIELDVQLTRDRVPVVFHDETLSRVCGISGRVRDYTFDELQAFPLLNTDQRIPRFEDVLSLVAGRVPLIVEIKIHENAGEVCSRADALLCAYGGPYCIESFHPMAVRWYQKNRPGVVRGQLSSCFHKPQRRESFVQMLVHHLLTNCLCRPDFIAYDHLHRGNLSRRLCRSLFGALSVAWTIRSQQELDACCGDFDLFIFEGFLPDA